ncbi:DUF5713 family protein [Spirillospora sp. NPDC052242]
MPIKYRSPTPLSHFSYATSTTAPGRHTAPRTPAGRRRRICARIEAAAPADLAALYELTHTATDEFNLLDEAFAAAGSEIETVARDVIAGDFWFIASSYGFGNADQEELVATRDW